MAKLTDPARELFDIATRLNVVSPLAGSELLAEQFNVDIWSTEFVKIISCIFERADLVRSIVMSAPLDDDVKINAAEDLQQFKQGFSGQSLITPWNQRRTGNQRAGGLAIMGEHGRPLQYLSQSVRPIVSYPTLTEEEIEEAMSLIDTHMADIKMNFDGPDFTKQAILDGLTTLQFQVKYMGWMGAGYALSAFREVVLTYDLVHRTDLHHDNYNAEAAFSGTLTIIKWFRDKIDTVEGWHKSAKTAWTGVQLASNAVTTLYLTGNLPALTVQGAP